MQQWGAVVAVVAAVKEEVGKIEDGEIAIAMEGAANVIKREKGSVGERTSSVGIRPNVHLLQPPRLLGSVLVRRFFNDAPHPGRDHLLFVV